MDGAMDGAHDFDLLGESVPQVRVSARTLALLGFFQLFIYSDSLLSEKISLFFEHLGGRCSQAFHCLPFGSGEKCQSAPCREVRQEYV